MANKYSGISDVSVFELGMEQKCWLCKESCNSGLWLHLGNGYGNDHIPLCLKHGITALECNSIDLPIGRHFLISRAEAPKHQQDLTTLRNIMCAQAVCLEEKYKRGLIKYWHETINVERPQHSTFNSRIVKEIYLQQHVHNFQAAIFEHDPNCFEVRYFHLKYVELGEYAWHRTRNEKATFTSDLESAKEIAQVELKQICLLKHHIY